MKPSKQHSSIDDIQASKESAWIADVVILSTAKGPLHCALVQDLKTERLLGWSTALEADPTLMMRAIELACTRHVRTRPTNLFLYPINDNFAPHVVATLVCQEFQLRSIEVRDMHLARSMERVWGELQLRFSQSLSKPAQFHDELDD
ncbi:hypothetical protein RTH74_15240 [Pseudomonas sp. zfem001]|uniref:hypothetical protein n=1 Tax=Pseudomonas sp. zfem001 TaxID=3078196 RepID=UPI0029283F76|nr:hypothetical protein [Pseudomonas sp. zfem001]MDU9408957.1 hypothetical protein [Pseudomonas sp. zfem001]